jgi:hypothetical protein
MKKKKTALYFFGGYILYFEAKPNVENFTALRDGSGVFI